MGSSDWMAAVLIAIGIVIRYQVQKRRFNRRGWGGVDYFKSYPASLLTRGLEKVASLFAWLCFTAAIFLMAIELINKH